MIDGILGLHMNPLTCGVAKFNHQLAKRLGLPYGQLSSDTYIHPLVSIKTRELEEDRSGQWWDYLPSQCDLFLHDRPRLVPSWPRRVWYADHIGCPSTINGQATRGQYRVLTFGMAHKLVLPHFERLKAELDREHPDYTVELSTAVHEGSPWDEALTEATDAMRGIFGDRLRVLGFLGDDALAKELHDVDAVAVYYTPALRANNTTAWAALEAGKKLYTNTDADSPALDVTAHSWDRLVELLRA